VNKANINNMIMIKSAQELVISLEPASGVSGTQSSLSDHHIPCVGLSASIEGGALGSFARVPSGSVSSAARPAITIEGQLHIDGGESCKGERSSIPEILTTTYESGR